jgi:NAD(P)-dependent dehydrogenase (short-subunit alcohol dehydrogenase family)
MLRLDGKVAVVTGCGASGSGWGNGKAIATLLARQGALVVGTDRNAEAAEATRRGIADEGNACEVVVSDASVGRGCPEADRRHGRAARPRRHPRQQCRTVRAGGTRRHGARDLGGAVRAQCHDGLPHLQARDPGHGTAGRRVDRERLVRRRLCAISASPRSRIRPRRRPCSSSPGRRPLSMRGQESA